MIVAWSYQAPRALARNQRELDALDRLATFRGTQADAWLVASMLAEKDMEESLDWIRFLMKHA
jgi:hypothetical protein